MNRLFVYILIIIILGSGLAGCGQKQAQPQPQNQQIQATQQGEKIPEQLTGIEENIEKIFMTLNAPSVQSKDEKKGGDTAKGGQDQAQQGGQQAQQGGQQPQQGQQQQAQQPPAKDPYDQVVGTVQALHYQWNEYMPQAIKAGASKSILDKFSLSLNNLTNTSATKNKNNTLLAANNLYSFIPDFYALYKTPTSPEIKRIRYLVRNAGLNAMIPNWQQADADMNSLKSSMTMYKSVAGKENQDLSNKLEFSVTELETVIKEKNQNLAEIKERVALANVQAIEKAESK